MNRWIGLGAAGMLLVGTGACARLLNARSTTEPPAAEEWPATLSGARSLAIDKRFVRADSVLARFASRYPGTPEALETTYWRGLFKMDPSNPNVSLPTAISFLDTYIGDERPREHVAEAWTIRRVAAQLEGLTRVAEVAVTEAREATNSAANAKAQAANANARAEAAKTETPADGEIKRLKDELAKANAELDRIRKRLTQPPQKP